MTRRWRSARAYALASVVAFMFLLTLLLGVAVTRTGYSYEALNAHQIRVEARAELLSLTNRSWKWLSFCLKTGVRPRSAAAESHAGLTNSDPLRIFLWEAPNEGKTEVYDLEYDPRTLAGSVADPLLLPPSCPDAYMIRATIEKKGLAPLTLESVYAVVLSDVPNKGLIYVLEGQPLYWRELFR